MQQRTLGTTSLQVSRLSLGTVTFGREINEMESFAVLDRADELGINLLDTAEAYGGGRSESIVGNWLASRKCRDRFIVQTKVAPPLTAARIGDSIDSSRRRLRTDAIDIFMLHAFDALTPLEKTLGVLGELVENGKAKNVGCSNFTADQISTALDIAETNALPRLIVTQCNYNLAVRDAEQSLFSSCRSRGVGVQTYSPLGAGFLTGKYAPSEPLPQGSRFDIVPGHKAVYFHRDQFQVVELLKELADSTGIPAPRLAIAWVLQNDNVDTVLVGARTPAHLDNAAAAMEMTFKPAWNADLDQPRHEIGLVQMTQEQDALD